MTSSKPLEQLINKCDPGWPRVAEWLRDAGARAEVLSADRPRSESVLVALQVTTRSPLGAIALETAGIIFDHGWVRLLGGGGPAIEGDLARWNGLGTTTLRPPFSGALIVGYDVLGGFFAINGGAFGDCTGNVFYFAPDSLQWEDMQRGYGDFVQVLCAGDLANFYANYRWESWQSEVSSIAFDKVLHILPPLWTKEGKDLERQSRRAIPAIEALALQLDVAQEIRNLPEGAPINLSMKK